jgi:hypothetical protein
MQQQTNDGGVGDDDERDIKINIIIIIRYIDIALGGHYLFT